MTLEEAIAEEREAERKLKKARAQLERFDAKRNALGQAEHDARLNFIAAKRLVAELMGGQ